MMYNFAPFGFFEAWHGRFRKKSGRFFPGDAAGWGISSPAAGLFEKILKKMKKKLDLKRPYDCIWIFN